MENTIFSRSPTPASTIESSPSIKQCVSEPGASGIWSYPISRSLPTLKLHTWTPSESQLCREDLEKIADVRVDEGRIGKGTNLATNGMKGSVAKRKRNVEGTTFVTDAEKQDTEERIAEVIEPFPKRPKYLQKSIWMDLNSSLSFSPTAQCTLTDDPLPRPPPVEFQNSEAITTINQNPHLFQIVTPIKVDQFEHLLETHPNRSFVESVCASLREGFWPWAHTQKEEYPVTWDFSDRSPKDENEAEFLRSQRNIEISARRYSESFGKELLPGMYSTPIHAVPKPRSIKLRLVNDHSAGPFSLNSMIAREDIIGAKMDSIADSSSSISSYSSEHYSYHLQI